MKHLLSILLLLLSVSMNAQDFDAVKKQSWDNFQKYKTQKENEFRGYRDKQNKQFEAYLRQSWEQYYSHEGFNKPKEKDVPPVVYDDKGKQEAPIENPIHHEETVPAPVPAPSPEPTYPIEENSLTKQKTASFQLYGTDFKVRYPSVERLVDVSENSVAAFWGKLSEPQFDNMLYDCLNIKQQYGLCDWAYLKLVEKVSESLYGTPMSAESVVLQSYILTQSGFRMYLAKDGQNRLHLLVPTDRDLLGYYYLDIDGYHCFVLDKSNADSFRVMNRAFEGTIPMSISRISSNRFVSKPSSKRALSSTRYPDARADVCTDVNLVSFYNEYPTSITNNNFMTRWSFYADTPLSPLVTKTLYPSLKKAIQGKTEKDAVEVLLNFVQTAFVYEYDDVVWGEDRAFFGEESLYYPYCDCEDRSILFSRIVRDLLGLNVVLIYYPGHLATAVHFTRDVPGDYYVISGDKFTVCDPTYIGAPVGASMPDLDYNAAVAIALN